MQRAIIVYESKFGNTAQVAEAIRAAIKRAGVPFVSVESIDSADVNRAATYEAILVGSPNHGGGPTRKIRKFIRNLAAFDLTGKRVAFFDTYVGGGFGKAVEKMQNELSARNKGVTIVTPGLSIRVEGVKGPLTDGELAKGDDFAEMVAGA